jgi:hypothetical protein
MPVGSAERVVSRHRTVAGYEHDCFTQSSSSMNTNQSRIFWTVRLSEWLAMCSQNKPEACTEHCTQEAAA